MLGLTNESDYYNYVSEGWMYIYECLNNVFTGAINDKLEDDIQCYSLDDVKRILNNEELCSKLCKYTITYVGLRFKDFRNLVITISLSLHGLTQFIFLLFLDKLIIFPAICIILT